MLTGLPPFYSKDRDKLFKNIKAAAIKYPNYLSKDALSLLQVNLNNNFTIFFIIYQLNLFSHYSKKIQIRD